MSRSLILECKPTTFGSPERGDIPVLERITLLEPNGGGIAVSGEMSRFVKLPFDDSLSRAFRMTQCLQCRPLSLEAYL